MGPQAYRSALERALATGRISHAAAARYIGVSRIVISIWLSGGAPIRSVYYDALKRFCAAVEAAVEHGQLPSQRTARPLGIREAAGILGKKL